MRTKLFPEPRNDIPHPFDEWLKAATPEEWHHVASNWNWDNGFKSLQWIIRQPNCDRGTALLIYWMGGADHMLLGGREAVSDLFTDHFDFLKEIEDRYTSGFYNREQIVFDPADEGVDAKSMQSDTRGDSIPPIMFLPTKGEKLAEQNGYDEGWPPELWERFDWVMLHNFWRSGSPIRFARKRNAESKGQLPTESEHDILGLEEIGFVLGVGAELFLFAPIAEDLRPNGFRVLRWRDLWQSPDYADCLLLERAFISRGDSVARPPEIALGSISEALSSLRECFPLLTVWTENPARTVRDRRTGRIESIDNDTVTMRAPSSEGEWSSYPFKMPLEWINRIDFGGAYERFLAEARGVI